MSVAFRIDGQNILDRAKERFSREMNRIPHARESRKNDLLRRIEAHRAKLPPFHSDDQKMLDSLEKVGTYISTLDQIPFPETDQLINSLEEITKSKELFNGDSRNYIGMQYESLLKFPGVYEWGLSPRLLDLVENYIGLPVQYRGAYVRREVANGITSGVRKWHIDVEDNRMLKIIIYLNDVENGGGPFEYLPYFESNILKDKNNYIGGYLEDADIEKDQIVASAKKEALYPKFTALFVDTCNLFHRAQAPMRNDRFTVTYSWSSDKPIKAIRDYAGEVTSAGERWNAIYQALNARQRSALPFNT